MPKNKKKGIVCREAQQGVSKFPPEDTNYTQVLVDRENTFGLMSSPPEGRIPLPHLTVVFSHLRAMIKTYQDWFHLSKSTKFTN